MAVRLFPHLEPLVGSLLGLLLLLPILGTGAKLVIKPTNLLRKSSLDLLTWKVPDLEQDVRGANGKHVVVQNRSAQNAWRRSSSWKVPKAHIQNMIRANMFSARRSQNRIHIRSKRQMGNKQRWREIESLSHQFTKLKARDKILIRHMLAKLAHSTR